MMGYEMKALEQILGCYFHQDWVDEFESDEVALRAIIDSEPIEQIRAGVMEIDELLASNLSEDQLKTVLMNKFGCYFDPGAIGATYENWLKKLRNDFTRGLQD